MTKLKTYQYEFKMGLTEYASGESWNYAGEEATNLLTLTEIVKTIKNRAFPVIKKFKTKPNILEQFDVVEMDNFRANWTKKAGVSIATTDIRFAWAMTIIFETTNSDRSKQFANWGLSHSGGEDNAWFGNKDFSRVLTIKNGA